MQFLTDAYFIWFFYRCSAQYVNETLCCWFLPYWGSLSWRNSPVDGGCSLPCLTFCSLRQQSTLHGTESSSEGQSCGVLLMVNVNFWQICRTYSLSVFISWCSYYHYLSLDHDSFCVPVEPHCAKYYRNTCLTLLFWLLSSRSALFVCLLPCYPDFFPVQQRRYLKRWWEVSGGNEI